MPPKSFKPTRERKQKRRLKSEEQTSDQYDELNSNSLRIDVRTTGPNADIIIPLTEVEKAEKRRQQFREELKAGQPKMSAKKQKRLNKYIETKLRKDEKVAILEKLAETRVDTSLFSSTRSIGTSRESKKQQIKRALLEEQAGINMEKNKAILYEERRIMVKELNKDSLQNEVVVEPQKEDSTKTYRSFLMGPVVGAGLKRPLDGAPSTLPTIKRIRKTLKIKRVMHHRGSGVVSEDSGTEEYGSSNSGSDQDENSCDAEEEWKGFSDEEDVSSESSDENSDKNSSSRSEGEGDNDTGEGLIDILKPGQSARANAFKEWASAQRRVTVEGETGVAKSNIETLMELKYPVSHVPRKREEDMTPPPEGLVVSKTARKVHYVPVRRPIEIQVARLALPVVAEEQCIMEAIHSHPCVVICGETGSGKTTQVPQFLYEAGYGSTDGPTPGYIAVTQPRRVAAVSMANRVGMELGPGGSEKVAYQIRFDGNVSPKTAIKFMTDGVLLREMASDFLLKNYSAVIIDEAHERNINTDILIGLMSRAVKLRDQMCSKDPAISPLKLIVMSATLRVSDFVENQILFPKPPPLLKVEARQHKVTVHFSRRTAPDYVDEAYKKVCRIHQRLPPGGILVFLTGQNEILTLLRKLKNEFPSQKPDKYVHTQVKVLASEAIVEAEDVEFGEDRQQTINTDEDPISDDEDQDLGPEMGTVDLKTPLHVLPLYSLLPTNEQLKVFEDVPDGSRLCVIATNVAETSLTIPGTRYVVDCGRSKERRFDKTTGVQSFEIQWTSKASAAQRAGRAGRTGPGHCYRLFSSAVYETDFPAFSQPEILRMPIEGLVLQMKAMHIDTIVNFPFPTPPDRESLQKALQLLNCLRAISPDGGLSELGRTMNLFPLSPRFTKILLISQQHGCLPYIIAIVAALSVGDIFIPEQQQGFKNVNDEDEDEETLHKALDYVSNIAEDAKSKMRRDYYRAQAGFTSLDTESDAVKLLSVVCAYDYEKNPAQFCTRNFIRLKAMEETRKLRQQIMNIVRSNCPGALPRFDIQLPPPSKLQVNALKQIIAAGFIDHVVIRADLLPNSEINLINIKQSTAIPYVTLFPSNNDHSAVAEEQFVYLHKGSVLASRNSKPEYIVYSELTRASSGSGKIWMKPLTTIKGGQLAVLAEGTPLITYSKPLESKPPKILPDSNGSRRECWVVPRLGAAIGKSSLGWPLPPQRITQRREGISRWVKE